MKTHKVRPVLISTTDTLNIYNILSRPNGKILICNTGAEYRRLLGLGWIPKELILISLEDEKIEVGDTFVNDYGEIIVATKEIIAQLYFPKKKVIARQSQIPSKHIYKFIEQYNNGCVEDIEIEMEHYWINSDSIKGEFFTEVAKFEPSINQYDAILNNRPKLTNGFVTTVEKEPVLYTEKEVEELCYSAMKERDFTSWNVFINWFEQNKKQLTSKCINMEQSKQFPIPITIEELLNNYTYNLTVGALKEFLNIHNIPDDAKVLIQRVEDVYYEKKGWGVYLKESHETFKDSEGNVVFESLEQYHPAFTCVKYDNDDNLFINLHY